MPEAEAGPFTFAGSLFILLVPHTLYFCEVMIMGHGSPRAIEPC